MEQSEYVAVHQVADDVPMISAYSCFGFSSNCEVLFPLCLVHRVLNLIGAN